MSRGEIVMIKDDGIARQTFKKVIDATSEITYKEVSTEFYTTNITTKGYDIVVINEAVITLVVIGSGTLFLNQADNSTIFIPNDKWKRDYLISVLPYDQESKKLYADNIINWYEREYQRMIS